MPARKWKWRMRGAAIWFAKQLTSYNWAVGRPHLVFANDMLAVADLRALLPPPWRGIPIVCYFHENQLTYPLSRQSERDFHFGVTNMTSCLAADAVWFNSGYHRESFLDAVDGMLAAMPDYVPTGLTDEIAGKSAAWPPPIDVPRPLRTVRDANTPPVILWCHRWEYDKNPDAFFAALFALQEVGESFEVVLTGEQFRTMPDVFDALKGPLAPRVRHAGFIPERKEYLRTLASCDIVVSTAVQENFGIAVVEAMLTGCRPLLPNRLSYPDILPKYTHDACLYPSDNAFFDCLRGLCRGAGRFDRALHERLIHDLSRRFSAETVIPAMDDALAQVACTAGSK